MSHVRSTVIYTRPVHSGPQQGQPLEFRLERQALAHDAAQVTLNVYLQGKYLAGGMIRKVSPAEAQALAKAGRTGITHLLGNVGLTDEEARTLQGHIDAQLDGQTRRGHRYAVATTEDHPHDPEIQAAYLKAQASGEDAFVRTTVEDAERPRIESSQDFIDLYVQPSGKLKILIRHAY